MRQALYGQRYLHEKLRHHGDDGRQRRLVRAQRDDPAAPARRAACDSYVFLRPGPEGERGCRRRSSGGSRRTARASSPTASRTSTARRGTTSASTSRRRSRCCRRARRGDGLLRRRQPRRRADPGEPRPDRAAERTRRPAAPRAELAAPLLRRRRGERRHLPTVAAASCSTTASAATRRTPASSAGTGAPRTCCSARRSGARSPTSLGVQPYPSAELDARRGSCSSSTSSTTRSPALDRAGVRGRARPARPRVVARRARVQPRDAVDRAPDRRSRPKTTCARSSSSTLIPGRCAPTPSSSTLARATTGARMSTTTATAVPMQMTRPLTTMSSTRGRLVFPADVPPLGYRVYRVRTGRSRASRSRAPRTPRSRTTPAARARPGDGADRAARASRRAASTSPRPAAHAVVVDDRRDTWGHGVRALRRRGRRSSNARRSAASRRAGAGDPARREPLRLLDAARGLRARRGRAHTSTYASRSTGTSS